jgi:hypothetical protein
VSFFVLFVISGYYLFEVGVCIVQAGVFSLLFAQYVDEHSF